MSRLPGLFAVLLLLTTVASPAGAAEAGTSAVTDLSIETGGKLHPAFDSVIHRYAVYPEVDGGPVTLRVSASPQASVTVNGSAAVDAGVVVDLPPAGRSFPVVVTHAGLTEVYELVVVPARFPVVTVTTLATSGAQPSDWPMMLAIRHGSLPTTYVVAVDNHGVPMKIVDTGGQPPALVHARQPGGRFTAAVTSTDVTSTGRGVRDILVLDRHLDVTDRLRTSPALAHTDGHDAVLRPNGNRILLAYEPATRNGAVLEDSIIEETTPAGEVVFAWNSAGAFDPAQSLGSNPTDWAHANSVFPEEDGYLVSLYFLGLVAKVRSDGTLAWTLGSTSSDFTFVDDPLGANCGGHNATRLANGNVLLFDNGRFCSPALAATRGETSRAVEYRVDEVTKTAHLVWSYAPGVYARAGGSAQRLPNGNTFIGWGGQANGLLATEVTADGTVVFEATMELDGRPLGTNRVFRADWPLRRDLVGVVDPITSTWHLPSGVPSFTFGNPGDQPLVGDWDCDGIDEPGVRRDDGRIYLRADASPGLASVSTAFGDPGDIALAGDFDGDGCDSIALYRPATQRFFITDRITSPALMASRTMTLGNPGDLPLAGDWDGDGVDEFGVHRPTTGQFHYRLELTSGPADGAVVFGNPGDRLLSGDWDFDQRDGLVAYRPADATFFARNPLTAGTADEVTPYGDPGWVPIAGDFGR